MQDVVDLLELRGAQAPDAPWLAWEPFEGAPREWTRAQFLREVRGAAGGLAARGVRAGDRVLVHGDNSPELLLAFFACAWLGAVCVILNPKSSADEIAYAGAHTEAVGIVTQAGLAATPASLARFATIGVEGQDGFAALCQAEAVPRARPEPGAPGCMMFTSGTTSRPKAVVWSRANALWAAQAGSRGLGLRPDDRCLVFVPLYHVVGLAWSVLPALDAGASVVLQPRFSASRFWQVAARRLATFASHVQFSSGVLARQEVPASHAFRLWGNSTWFADYEGRFGVPLLGWWGMTELVAPGLLGRHGVPQADGSIGFAAPGYALRIAGSGRCFLTPGEAGELEVLGERGRTLFSGYWRDDAATAAAFTEDGWFRTGDRVTVHADGSVQFLERARDVIKTGGEGVSPAEVERVVREVPGVANACLVGRPDPALGEVSVAFVVAAEGAGGEALAQRILAACRDKLAGFKVPREVRFLDALPLVGIEKVAKGELRRLAQLSAPDPSSRG